MSPTITAFAASPDKGRGLARDMRVRWAFEEVGQAYDVRLVTFAEMKQPSHLALQPFGQIPTYEAGGLSLFETGAIVLEIARMHGGLLPAEAEPRARAIQWMFASVATVEPPIVERSLSQIVEKDKPWYAARATMLDERARVRLGQLSARLAGCDWLDGAFSAGDLMMVHAIARARDLLSEFPNLSAYVARAEARGAYQRAFAAQLAVFEAGRTEG